ncbi:MAG: ferric reductase, partial [Acidimicrobiia bacterium]|nr:ferric reductase [Acidimicrobiia bacterium]
TGSDTRQAWMLVVDAVALACVTVAASWRIAAGWRGRTGGRVAVLASTVLVPVALATWAVVGPLQPGWARTSGTPARLLGSSDGGP